MNELFKNKRSKNPFQKKIEKVLANADQEKVEKTLRIVFLVIIALVIIFFFAFKWFGGS